jgi:hypothetical protein
MQSLIESLVTAPDMADTAVILSTLTHSGQDNIEATRQSVNTEFRTLVETMRADNVSIILADMDPPAPSPDHNWLSILMTTPIPSIQTTLDIRRRHRYGMRRS